MKKMYERPMANIEEFAANEYVATCWKVGCSNNTTYRNHNSNAPYGNQWKQQEGRYNSAFSHNGTCRHAENNYFSAIGTSITFKHEDTTGQGNDNQGSELGGGFDYWYDKNGDNIVNAGDVVYWHTTNSEPRTWNHWGYVETVDKAHVNRS